MLIPDPSGRGLDAYIANILRAEAVIDSINADPHTTLHEFNDYHRPAVPFTTLGGLGIFLKGDCGDCKSGSLFFARRGRIAEVRYTIDDREPNIVRLACHLARVGKTFQWFN